MFGGRARIAAHGHGTAFAPTAGAVGNTAMYHGAPSFIRNHVQVPPISEAKTANANSRVSERSPKANRRSA